MRRFALALLVMLGFMPPARAVEFMLQPITTAGTVISSNFQMRYGPGVAGTDMTFQANLTYGSGGTTIDAYVQTSLDGGGTWVDISNFHFTTSSARLLQSVSMASSVVASATAGDGALAANTSITGLFGNLWRVKVVSVGTYAGGTSLRIDAVGIGLTVP